MDKKKEKLNEISQATLKSYIKKSAERARKEKDQDKPYKGAKADYTSQTKNKADELANKLRLKGKSTKFLKTSQSKPTTQKYTYKGAQWVDRKSGRIAKKEVGAELTKKAKESGKTINKKDQRLTGIEQASKRLSDNKYKIKNVIATGKSKMKTGVRNVKRVSDDLAYIAKKDSETLKKKSSQVTSKIKDILKKKREDKKSQKGSINIDKSKKNNINNYSNRSSVFNGLETGKKEVSKKQILKPKYKNNYKIEVEHGGSKKTPHKNMYNVDVHYTNKLTGKTKVKTAKINANSHSHAKEIAGTNSKHKFGHSMNIGKSSKDYTFQNKPKKKEVLNINANSHKHAHDIVSNHIANSTLKNAEVKKIERN